MYKKHTICRACGYGKPLVPDMAKGAAPERMIPVFNLGIHPLANDFRNDTQEHSGYAPLEVLFCPRCSLAQLSVVVNPEILYSNYSYVTSPSQTMLQHFEHLYNDLKDFCNVEWNVMEIGSNDGALLSFLKNKMGVASVIGIDPAQNLSSIAMKNGINTHCGFWGNETARNVAHYHPNLILARHVFAHIGNWHEFFEAMGYVAGLETLIAIEIPDTVSMLRGLEFDVVYHEHLSYPALKSIEWLLKDTPFQVVGVRRYSIHGGAMMILIASKESRFTKLDIETDVTLEDWQVFSTKACQAITSIRAFVLAQKASGKRIVGYGASAKSTVMLNACGLNASHIDFICDATPFKQWKKSPGTGIPIVDEGALLREMPDYAIVFAWNFFREIVEKNQLYLSKGGKLVKPIPEVEVVSGKT